MICNRDTHKNVCIPPPILIGIVNEYVIGLGFI
jgi:hypothetical protein